MNENDRWLYSSPPNPDIWPLGQLRRTELVITYLAECVRPGGTGSPMTAQETVPGMSNSDLIAAILYARKQKQRRTV